MAFRLIPSGIQLNFMRYAKAAVVISTLLVVASLGLLMVRSLNFGVDFTGGVLVQIQTEQDQQVSILRKALSQYNGLTLQEYGAPNEFLLRLPSADGSNTGDLAQNIAQTLQPSVGEVQIRRVEFVGPQVGQELRQQGVLAVLASLLVILIYISARFELRYGVGALVALAHDVIITLGLFSLLGKEFTLPVLAAVLTIIGYSLNDTIVVFDRIREERRKREKSGFKDVLNFALSKTLGRTIMTSFTTLLVLLALLFFGGAVIHDFAFALVWGVVIGTYSSLFIASPVLLAMDGFTKRLGEKLATDETEEKL